MTLEKMNMNDIEGELCHFCGKPISARAGYTVSPGENGNQEIYHHTEILRCYDEKNRKKNDKFILH